MPSILHSPGSLPAVGYRSYRGDAHARLFSPTQRGGKPITGVFARDGGEVIRLGKRPIQDRAGRLADGGCVSPGSRFIGSAGR
ncbi:hypothetical protein NITHO_2210005 [Nitrolancea hollandica Lb]|uniref:Uncharacterized protein n=1 Tax=Nitrolancea hollandica Lb TaxID=1129897 RepID=I4EF48_9BACT|nr:hypothetical protein NITHO_2210005 [Nitrolancea hollandica Lb]